MIENAKKVTVIPRFTIKESNCQLIIQKGFIEVDIYWCEKTSIPKIGPILAN